MTSVKCPQCGLVYWSTNENCRRCGLATDGGPADDQQMDEPQSYAQSTAPQPLASQTIDEEQMLRNLKRDSKLFYFIGGLQIVLWLFVGNLLVLDGVCNIGLSFLAYKFKSRVAAILLMLLTFLSVLVALLALVTGALHFNLFTPIVIIWRLVVSIRMVYATFKLHAHAEVDVTRMMPPLPPVFHKEEETQWAQPAGAVQWQPE
jgi:fatty acid desaturase